MDTARRQTGRDRKSSAIERAASRAAKPALVALLAVCLLLNLLNFAAAFYQGSAERHLDALPDEAATRDSAIAAALTPWSAPRQALRGWIQADAGAIDSALASYGRALRAAPADALLWTELALALSRNRIFDGRLDNATAIALVLAPSSPAVRRSVAHMALKYWRRGSPALREYWQQTLRWELDHNRTAFLQFVEQEGVRASFCREHGEALGETAWCRSPHAPG